MHYRFFDAYDVTVSSSKEGIHQLGHPTVSDRYVAMNKLFPVLDATSSVSSAMITMKLQDSSLLKLGLILLTVPNNDDDTVYEGKDALIGHAVDLSVCLRTAGADLIVAVTVTREDVTLSRHKNSAGSNFLASIEQLEKSLSRYIDMLLVRGSNSSIDCELNRRRSRGISKHTILPVVALGDRSNDDKIGLISASRSNAIVTIERSIL